jgi:hypothetical protein
MTDPAAKQYYRCANTPNSNISKLINFSCPLHKKKKFTGNFRESGYRIDFSGIALCPDCYSKKQLKYFEEIDNINAKYGMMRYDEFFVNSQQPIINEVSSKKSSKPHYLDNSESYKLCLDSVSSSWKPLPSKFSKHSEINQTSTKKMGDKSETIYSSILTSDVSELEVSDGATSDTSLSTEIPLRCKNPKRITNPKKSVKRSMSYKR